MGQNGMLGKRIAYQRRISRMTQEQLADTAGVHVGTLRKIERGARGASQAVLDALAAALGVDPSHLVDSRRQTDARVHQAMPDLSMAIATYDMPADGPIRPLPDLRAAVSDAAHWRLGSQYVRISRHMPALLSELARALHAATTEDRTAVARLLVSAYRAADAVAYKFGARDLSARLINLMEWAAAQADSDVTTATVAYVRTEIYFAARAHHAGLRALQSAIDHAPAAIDPTTVAACGALHMRAAVIAGRSIDPSAARMHLAEARALAARVPEGVYDGTAFGPHSVRIHEVAVAVSLGSDHVSQALAVAAEWEPPRSLPAERRSGFYIELARAQLWSGQPREAFESLKTARRIAPQHTREHRWVREDAATLRRLRRADVPALSAFAEWCGAGE
ncbi:helix-turn-helix domain-containing protein [Streptomyces buecherae]|uniref:helix-turn-helix domain-containing protein n=1 Tax=Streptomyces buecherae TaxID=2763006 RepID=UPI001C2812AD|nr:helix-turn-helix transcriptional regulator [Streptomyces buecherae]